jgi:hypothetical protein
VFRHLVLARIIEPASKLDSLRVLGEAGVAPPSYATLSCTARAQLRGLPGPSRGAGIGNDDGPVRSPSG